MELSFNFIAVIFITIRALAKSKIITYVRGKLKNLVSFQNWRID